MAVKRKNSSTLTIHAENLSDAITDLLREYGTEVTAVLDESAKETARQSVLELKRLSAKRNGNYAKNWTFNTEKKGRMDVFGHTYVVHNDKTYRLTHLLENGHNIVNTHDKGKPVKSRSKKTVGDGVIARVEEFAVNYYAVEFEKALTKLS